MAEEVTGGSGASDPRERSGEGFARPLSRKIKFSEAAGFGRISGGSCQALRNAFSREDRPPATACRSATFSRAAGLESKVDDGGKRVGDYLLSEPKRRKERLRPFEFNAEELEGSLSRFARSSTPSAIPASP